MVMSPKPICVLLLGSVLGFAQPQAGDPSLRGQSPGQLPVMLSEMEKQLILKEQNPKSHVESALKVAETRIQSAFRLAQDSQYRAAAQDLETFLALIVYADAYVRKELASKNKDRNHCLKKIEQTVFKQSRTLEAITRELPLESREAVEPRIGEVKKIRLRAINDLLGKGQVIDSSN